LAQIVELGQGRKASYEVLGDGLPEAYQQLLVDWLERT
jgi:hypothetical protein